MIQRKKFELLICWMGSVLLGMTLNAQSIDRGPEFMGFYPGRHADSLPAVKSQGKYQKLDRAIPLLNDSLSYSGIPVKSVVLFFHRNLLHSVDVKITPENSDAMFVLMQALYGPAERVDHLGVQQRWMGEKFGLYYEKNMITQETTYSFVSFEVNEKYNAWLQWLTAPK